MKLSMALHRNWKCHSISILLILIYKSQLVKGFFQIGVETLQKPAAGEPVNVQIIVAPQVRLDDKNDQYSASQDYYQERRAGGPNEEGESQRKNFPFGLGRRRGIFNIPLPSLELPRLSPATINIQIPGKLPFNPLNIFNVQTLKSFVQSMTDKYMKSKNDKRYKTGFGDSVTIISEDPEKPVSENYGPQALPQTADKAVAAPKASTDQIEGNEKLKQDRSGLPMLDHHREATVFQVPKEEAVGDSINSASNAETTTKDLQLSEESMIDRQVATLNEVLTNEMNHDKDKDGGGGVTSPSPPRVSFLPDLSALSQLFNWGEHSVRSLAVCNACKVAFGLFVSQARQGANLTNLMDLATFGCTFFRITSSEMCSGLVSSFGPILHYMVMHKSSLNGDTFCGISLQSSGCKTSDPDIDWKIDVNQYSSVPLLSDFSHDFADNTKRRRSVVLPSSIPVGGKTLKVLHLTDLHIDFNYHIGAMTDCENELCCHMQNGKGIPGKRAGYFGDYGKCDLPFHSYIEALQHISSTHPDIKMVYLTGDFVPHNIWTTSPSSNMGILVNASKYIQDYFPKATIIPVIGNHEAHPVNMFSPFGVPSEFSTDWLYTTAAKAWSHWLPKESIHNFLHAGFYDVEIDPYFRVIVLNTNLCYGYNFWQAFDHKDPSGQLRWLARELQRSEDAGQFVHILGHMAPTEADCWTVWAQNFYEIINRYKGTVKAQFYGHTHFDEFKLYYNLYNRSEAVSPAWIGASLTPFADLNPGYKIFTVDGARGKDSTWDILEHETWIYNLTEANLNPSIPPKWFRLYKATEAFDIPDLSPNSLNKVVQRMSYNATAFDIYYRLYHKDTDSALKHGCNAMCRKRVLCGIVTPTYEEYKYCIQLKPDVKGVILSPQLFVDGSSTFSLKRGSTQDTAFQRMISFGRSLFRALG